MGPSLILNAFLAWVAHRAPYAAYTMKALVVEFAVWHLYHLIQKFPYIPFSPVDDRRYQQCFFTTDAAYGLLFFGMFLLLCGWIIKG